MNYPAKNDLKNGSTAHGLTLRLGGLRASAVLAAIFLGVACTPTNPPLSEPSSESSEAATIESGESEPVTELVIAMIPSQSSDEEAKQRQLLADYLQEQLELPVSIEIPQDYDGAIELLAEEKVQMAYLGPFSFVKAQQRNPLLEPIVAPIDKRTGRPSYNSVIVANAERGINSIEDLNGKNFSFVSESSTSGYLVPLGHLIDVGIEPEQDFATTTYAGSHNKNLEALLAGTVDAIGVNKPTYLKAQQAGDLPTEQYPLLWESDPIPNAPVVISSKLPTTLKLALQQALLDAPTGLSALSGAKSDGYTLVEDKDYDVVRELQQTLGVDVKD